MDPYTPTVSRILGIPESEARLVVGYLRLQYGTLDHLSQERIRFEYLDGGPDGSIKDTIEADRKGAERLADDYGC